MTPKVIYNITFQIEPNDAAHWTRIVLEEVIPSITDGKVILEAQVNKILVQQSDMQDSYALQFTFSSAETFNRYKLSKMQILISLLDAKMRGRYLYFGTMMELLHYYNKTSN